MYTRGMGKQGSPGPTTHRTVRIGNLWTSAQKIAAIREETMTDVVERGLRNYVARHRHVLDEPEPPQSG